MVAEGRSRQPALLLPELTFAGQQPLSEQRRDMAPEKAVLDEVAVISDEDLFNVLGPVQEQSRPRPEPHPDHVPVLAGARRQEAQGIARQFDEAANKGQAFRTRRTPVHEDPSFVASVSHGSALSSRVDTKSFEPLAPIAQSSCRVVHRPMSRSRNCIHGLRRHMPNRMLSALAGPMKKKGPPARYGPSVGRKRPRGQQGRNSNRGPLRNLVAER